MKAEGLSSGAPVVRLPKVVMNSRFFKSLENRPMNCEVLVFP